MSPNDAGRMANSVDPDQTAPLGAVWSGSALFAQAYLSENLGSLQYFVLFISFNRRYINRTYFITTSNNTSKSVTNDIHKQKNYLNHVLDDDNLLWQYCLLPLLSRLDDDDDDGGGGDDLGQLMRLWYASYRRPAKAQVSLRICASTIAVCINKVWK